MVIKSNKNNDDYMLKGLTKINNPFYREFACSLIKKINNNSLACNFVRLATNPNLLASDKYKYALDIASKIEKFEFLNIFVSIACNKNLIKNVNYELLLNRILYIKDIRTLFAINSIVESTSSNEISDYSSVIFDRLITILNISDYENKVILINDLNDEINRNRKVKTLK